MMKISFVDGVRFARQWVLVLDQGKLFVNGAHIMDRRQRTVICEREGGLAITVTSYMDDSTDDGWAYANDDG